MIGELKEMSEVVPISDDVKKPYIRRYKTLYIKSFLPWPTFLRFYDGYGRVVPEKVASLLGDLLPNVVGWYRCRPFPGTMITNRETMIQQHLRSLVPLLPKYFVFCLVIKNEAENGNPLSFDHKFFNYDSRFELVSHKILNLLSICLVGDEFLQLYPGVVNAAELGVGVQEIISELKNRKKMRKMPLFFDPRLNQIAEELLSVELEANRLENELRRTR